MKKLLVTLYGTSPLIMHSPKTVNPLHPIAREMKQYTSKRKKTEEDLLRISDLEWEAGVYWDENIGLHIPNECISATLKSGAKFNKNGAAVARYCHIITPLAPLDIGETQNYETLKTDQRHAPVSTLGEHSSRCSSKMIKSILRLLSPLLKMPGIMSASVRCEIAATDIST